MYPQDWQWPVEGYVSQNCKTNTVNTVRLTRVMYPRAVRLPVTQAICLPVGYTIRFTLRNWAMVCNRVAVNYLACILTKIPHSVPLRRRSQFVQGCGWDVGPEHVRQPEGLTVELYPGSRGNLPANWWHLMVLDSKAVRLRCMLQTVAIQCKTTSKIGRQS